MSYNSESRLSEYILNELYKRYTDSRLEGGFPDREIICKEYFGFLHTVHSDWKMRSFDNQHSLLSKDADVEESVRHLRMYTQCFLNMDYIIDDINLPATEDRLFPFLTMNLPTFTRWDGSIVREFPCLDDSLNACGNTVSADEENQYRSFWGNIKNSMNGKGLVISIADIGVDETKRLLKTLRLLGNQLPIQLVHKGDLHYILMAELVAVARNELIIEIDGKLQSIGYPQDIWFVNTEPCLKPEALKHFKRFSNKWLAAMFNSFEEMILLDTDTVLFVNPKHMFETPEYSESGTHFFRDRPIAEFVKKSDVTLYHHLLPSLKERSLLGIPSTSKYTLQNPFFKSQRKHVMESGLVVINRKQYLDGLLISTFLQLWEETSSPFHGDKELFWLGQAISGKDRYKFNKNVAGAIGILRKDEKDGTEYICSTQIAHFNDEYKLLWINGGLKNCKLPAWNYDFKKKKAIRKKYTSVENVKKHYQLPVVFDGAIIPPDYSNKSYHKTTDERVKNGFLRDVNLGCGGYTWCAYNSLDSPEGKVLRFDETESQRIKNIIEVWNSK